MCCTVKVNLLQSVVPDPRAGSIIREGVLVRFICGTMTRYKAVGKRLKDIRLIRGFLDLKPIVIRLADGSPLQPHLSAADCHSAEPAELDRESIVWCCTNAKL